MMIRFLGPIVVGFGTLRRKKKDADQEKGPDQDQKTDDEIAATITGKEMLLKYLNAC